MHLAVTDGKCRFHRRPPWANPSQRNLDRPPDWNRRKRFVLRRDRRVCYLCSGPATEVDHVLPVSKGGSHDYRNLKAVCSRCHKIKTVRDRYED